MYLGNDVKKLAEELKKLEMGDLHGAFVKEGVKVANMWTLTEKELRDLGANLMQRKAYQQEKERRSGNVPF